MPSDPWSLDPDPTLQIPPAFNQSRKDTDTADPTLDLDKPLKPGPSSDLSPHKFPTSKLYFESHNASSSSSGEKPEQSNARALEAAEEDVDSLSVDWSAPDPDAYRAPENYLVELEPPVKTSTMKNVESQQRNTSASEDALDPATEYAQTSDEAMGRHSREQEERESRLEERLEMWNKANKQYPPWTSPNPRLTSTRIPPPPPPRNKFPDDTRPLLSASQPAPMPYVPTLDFNQVGFDPDSSLPPLRSLLRGNGKQPDYSKQPPPVPFSRRQPKRPRPYVNNDTLPPSLANGSENNNPNPNNSPNYKKDEPRTEN
jgi:hypothetical protein